MNITTSNISYNSARVVHLVATLEGDLIIDKSTFYGHNSINSIWKLHVTRALSWLNFSRFDCGHIINQTDLTGCLL